MADDKEDESHGDWVAPKNIRAASQILFTHFHRRPFSSLRYFPSPISSARVFPPKNKILN